MSHLHFNLLTLFPEMFPGSLGHSLSGKALESGAWSYEAVNIRDFAEGVHKAVDDTPYGGGAGMVMRADVIEKALLSLDDGLEMTADRKSSPSSLIRYPSSGRRIYLSPRGTLLTQSLVRELTAEPALTLLCGRYEGVDERLLQAYNFEEISVGDYVLSGGEPAALILMDACIRLLPGVMGNDQTPHEESFSNGLLEYPHYTRPAVWTAADGTTYSVPDVLTSGDHAKIKHWREAESLALTQKRRPDLVAFLQEGTKAQRNILQKISKAPDIEAIAKEIVDCAFQVHKQLGPGLLESVYEVFFIQRLRERGLIVKRQIDIPIQMDDITIDRAFKADLIVNDCILIELKAVEHILPVHKAQTISYLKLTGLPLGFLINFGGVLLKDGIRRFAN